MSLGYAVVSWWNEEPQFKDITGKGPGMDVPFADADEAEQYLRDAGYSATQSDSTAVVAELTYVRTVD